MSVTLNLAIQRNSTLLAILLWRLGFSPPPRRALRPILLPMAAIVILAEKLFCALRTVYTRLARTEEMRDIRFPQAIWAEESGCIWSAPTMALIGICTAMV